MFDDDGAFAFFAFCGAGLALVIGLIWWMIASENADLADFKARCMAIPKSEAECQLLTEIKSKADDAANTSAMAIGFAAGSSAGRR